MAEGRARGATRLEPTVWEFDQAALAFYERLGLATIYRRPGLNWRAAPHEQSSRTSTRHNVEGFVIVCRWSHNLR